MGLAHFIVLKPKPKDLDTYVNGRALGHASDELAALAGKLRVRPLLSFFSAAPEDAAIFDVPADNIATQPPEQWFSPADGLITVRALLGAVDKIERLLPAREGGVGVAGKRKKTRRKPSSHAVIADLEAFEKLLSEAERRGLLWHLAIDI
jgi:hypothetical protein